MNANKRLKMLRVVRRFDLACRNHEMLYSQPPEFQKEIEQEYKKAKKLLIKYIEEISKPDWLP